MKSKLLFFIILFFGLSFDRLNIFKYCILSSVFHEIGHITAYRVFTKKIPNIEVSPFGFRMKNNVMYNKFYIFILISGPIMNLILYIITSYLLKIQFHLNIYVLNIINLIIFTVNMLPVYYLDGGQILLVNSEIYQKYYKAISLLAITIISVMLIHFTGINIGIIVFYIYFIINTINDV